MIRNHSVVVSHGEGVDDDDDDDDVIIVCILVSI